jgi:hypothetical protein
MEPPVRELDDDGPLNYAPKKPRLLEQDHNPVRARLKVVHSAAPPDMPLSSEPPWKQKQQRGAFAGDIATGELRPRLSLVPDRVPEPQSSHSTVPVFGTVLRLVGIIAVAAAAIVGYRWGSAPQVTPPPRQLAPASNRTDFTPGLTVPTANLKVSNPDLSPAASRSAASADTSERDADAAQAATAGVTSTAAAPQADAPEIALLLRNGAELMANGDVAAARLMFRHAAEAGSADAAFALAETYDPLVYKKTRRRGAITLDITLARSWYETARNLGSAAARDRIVRLTQLPE